MVTDYERGVEQASAVYEEVIREYVAENAELRELLVEVLYELDKVEKGVSHGWFWEAARELGVEAD